MPYSLLATALIVVSILKHLSLQRAGLQERAGPVEANIFIGLWMLAAAGVAALFAPAFRDAVAESLRHAPAAALGLAAFKGLLVMAIVTGKQHLLAGRRTNAYALVAFFSAGPLGLVNGLMGERLSQMQYVSVAGLSLFGLLFLFYGEMKGAGWRDRLAFLLVVALGSSTAMADHALKTHHVSWQATWVLSNIALFCAALALSLKTGGRARTRRALEMSVRDATLLMAAGAWVLSEAVVLWISFTQLDVTVSETTRNLYIPLLMILSAALFPKGTDGTRRKEMLKAALLGGVAYALALPMMVGG